MAMLPLKYLEEGGECDIVVSDVMMPGMQGDVLLPTHQGKQGYFLVARHPAYCQGRAQIL